MRNLHPNFQYLVFACTFFSLAQRGAGARFGRAPSGVPKTSRVMSKATSRAMSKKASNATSKPTSKKASKKRAGSEDTHLVAKTRRLEQVGAGSPRTRRKRKRSWKAEALDELDAALSD